MNMMKMMKEAQKMQKRLIADDELIEWMCENEKDLIHMVGK